MRLKIICLMFLLLPCLAIAQWYSADGDTLYMGNNGLTKNKHGYIDSDHNSNNHTFPGLTAEWNSEVYVSDTTRSQYMLPKICLGSETVHIFSESSRTHRAHHYISIDSGRTWQFFAEYHDTISVIAADDINIFFTMRKLYTTWDGGLANENSFVLFRASTDEGQTWPIRSELRFWWPFDDAMRGNVTGHGDTVYASFVQDSLTCWRSTDMGRHWTNPGFIGSPQEAYPPSITYGAGVAGIVYTRDRENVDNVYYVNSYDKGQTWTQPAFIGLSYSWGGQWPEMAADSFGNVAVCWMDYINSPYTWTGGIWCRISHDSGQTWGSPVMLNSDYRGEAGTTVVIDGNYVGAAWGSTGPNDRLSYRESYDGG